MSLHPLYEASLKVALEDLGLQPSVKVIANHGFRWTLDFTQDPAYPDFGKSMIKLERKIQELTGRPVDLRLESKEDKNKREKRNVLWTKTV